MGTKDIARSSSGIVHSVKRWMQHPISKILFGCITVIMSTFLLKVLIVKPGLEWLQIPESIGKPIQWSLTLGMGYISYILFFRWIENRSITELSVRHAPRELFTGFALGALCISVCLFFLMMMGYFKIKGIHLNRGLPSIFIFILLLATLEEIIFRGILYRILQTWLGTHLALVISSLLFGILHITNEDANFISIVAVVTGGAMIGIVYTLSNRLWLPIALHSGWNFSQIFYGVQLSGSEDFLNVRFFDSQLAGPELWTGGAFGVENSIFAISLTGFIFVLIYIKVRREGKLVYRSSR